MGPESEPRGKRCLGVFPRRPAPAGTGIARDPAVPPPAPRMRRRRASRSVSPRWRRRSAGHGSARQRAGRVRTGLPRARGDLRRDQVHMGSLQAFIAHRRRQGVKTRTINHALQVVRHILNPARMILFKVNTGCREQEICGLRSRRRRVVRGSAGSARPPLGTDHDALLGGGVGEPHRGRESGVCGGVPQKSRTGDVEATSGQRVMH